MLLPRLPSAALISKARTSAAGDKFWGCSQHCLIHCQACGATAESSKGFRHGCDAHKSAYRDNHCSQLDRMQEQARWRIEAYAYSCSVPACGHSLLQAPYEARGGDRRPCTDSAAGHIHHPKVLLLRSSPNFLAGSTGCHNWEAGFVLAQYVLSHARKFQGEHCCQLDRLQTDACKQIVVCVCASAITHSACQWSACMGSMTTVGSSACTRMKCGNCNCNCNCNCTKQSLSYC